MYQNTTIIGNVGSCEMRFTAGGVPVTAISVACNEKWKDAEGQQHEKTTWYRCTAWRKLAEVCGQYVTKGMQVMVVGQMEQPNVYQNKAGEYTASLELTAREVKFLGSRGESAQAPQQQATHQQAQPQQQTQDERIPF